MGIDDNFGKRIFEATESTRRMNRNQILHAAIETFGRERQIMKMVGEMGELAQAISKLYDAKTDQEIIISEMHINDEMADVQIMLDQMRILFGSTDIKERKKLIRLQRRIEEKMEDA